jgi:hypothetical protein
MVTLTYDGTENEMMRIVSEQTGKGLILIKVANITEGNFLQFVNVPPLDIEGAMPG